MLSLIAHRIARLVILLGLVSLITFAIVNVIPGDAALAVLGAEASDAQLAAFRREHGFDQPMLVQYGRWLGDVVRGDLGQSLRTRQSVTESIRERLPVSIQLMVMTQVVALIVAVPMALYAGYRQGGRFDRVTTVGSFAAVSTPNFMLALLLIYVFAVQLNWLPATGYSPLADGVVANLRTMALPVMTLVGTEIAVYLRLLRSDVITTLQEPHVDFARAKGVPTWRILTHHVLRLSSFSVLTLVGINIGRLLGGAVIIETLFGLPGVGRLLIQSIGTRDIFVLQGVVLFTACVYVLANIVVDLLYGILDPRTRSVSPT